MPLKKGHPRAQTLTIDLENFIGQDNQVRVIDAFVDSLDLEALGFKSVGSFVYGAPAYGSNVLLKIYLYGYLNRVRSSRRLEAEYGRNLEMYWLFGAHKPTYHTISTFRTLKTDAKGDTPAINHSKALQNVFRTFTRFISGLGLFGKEVMAIDGTKIHAQNSKKNNIPLLARSSNFVPPISRVPTRHSSKKRVGPCSCELITPSAGL